MFKRLTYLGVLLLSVSALRAQTSPKTMELTWEQATSYALQNNNDVKLARLNEATAAEQVKEYTAVGLPQAKASLNYIYNIQLGVQVIDASAFNPSAPPNTYTDLAFGTKNRATAGVEVSQLVFDGSYFVGLQAAKGLRTQINYQSKVTESDVANNVKKAYLNVLLVRISEDILQKNINNLQKVSATTQELKKNGFVEQLDVDRITLSLKNLSVELANLKRQESTAVDYLKFLIGAPMDTELTLTETIESLMAQAVKAQPDGAISFEKRPEYKYLKQTEYLNQLNLKRYQAAYLPSLAAFANYSVQLQRNKLFDNNQPGWKPGGFYVGLGLSIPLFDGFGKQSKIAQAKIVNEQLAQNVTNLERAITLQVNTAKTNLTNATQRLADRQESLQMAERIYNTTQVKYKEGVGTSIEVTSAEREVYTAQANVMSALYDLLSAQIDLDKALGN